MNVEVVQKRLWEQSQQHRKHRESDMPLFPVDCYEGRIRNLMDLMHQPQWIAAACDRVLKRSRSQETSGKPDAWKLARPVWGWGRGGTPRPTPPSKYVNPYTANNPIPNNVRNMFCPTAPERVTTRTNKIANQTSEPRSTWSAK